MLETLTVPSTDSLMWPALSALSSLGGSASHQELLDKVVELEKIPETIQNVMHVQAAGWTRLSYNLGVVKIALGKAGVLDVSRATKGMWIMTEKGMAATENDLRRIPRFWRNFGSGS